MKNEVLLTRFGWSVRPRPKAIRSLFLEGHAKNILFGLFFTALSLLLAGASFGATYYVSPSGNDSNNGSITAPFLTPVHAASQMTTAGDILYFRSGTYNITTSSGFEASAIYPRAANCTFAIYPADTAGSVTLLGSPSGNYGVAPTDGVIGDEGLSGTTISGLVIKGIVVVTGSNTTVSNNDVSVGVDNWSGNGQGEVIWVQNGGTGNVITNNNLHDNGVSTDGSGTNDSLIMAYQSSGLTITHNNFYNSQNMGLYIKDSQSNDVIAYNYFYNNADAGIFGANQANGAVSNNNSIYQNVFVNNNTSGSEQYGAVTIVVDETNLNIYNNTFYKNNNGDIVQPEEGIYNASMNVWNNIFFDAVGGVVGSYASCPLSGLLLYNDYNDYYGGTGIGKYGGTSYSSLSSWQSEMSALSIPGAEAHSVTTSPGFLNASGSYSTPSDFKLSTYTANGRGGSYASVMGAYITGNETIGASTSVTNTNIPSPPKSLGIQ